VASPPANKLVTTGGYFPSPAATDPDYSVAGEIQPPTVDASGFANVRAPVLTDEGGFREMFATDPFGAPPGTPPWVVTRTSGTLVVAGGLATFTSGAVANGVNWVSRPVDFMPLIVNVELLLSARNVALSTVEFFIGLYSDPDPAVAIAGGEFCEVHWLWSDTNIQAHQEGGVGGFLQPPAPVVFAITDTTTRGFRTQVLDGEGAVYRDGATTLPTPTVRNTISTKTPGLYTDLHLGMGFRNGPTASNRTATIYTVYVKNTNRLVVNTTF
jgi:hypothetical protein